MMRDRMMTNRWLQGIAALLCTLALSGPAVAAGTQRTFASPEMAVEALVDGVARNDGAEVRAILGIKSEKLVPLDSVSLDDRLTFLAAWAQGHRILNDGDKAARLELSTGWTLPIPLARTRLDLTSRNFAAVRLSPRDTIRIPRSFGDRDTGPVILVGEFLRPGSYDIRRGERLSEIIGRAGGLTPQAYPYGAVFVRDSLRRQQKLNFEKALNELQIDFQSSYWVTVSTPDAAANAR